MSGYILSHSFNYLGIVNSTYPSELLPSTMWMNADIRMTVSPSSLKKCSYAVLEEVIQIHWLGSGYDTRQSKSPSG